MNSAEKTNLHPAAASAAIVPSKPSRSIAEKPSVKSISKVASKPKPTVVTKMVAKPTLKSVVKTDSKVVEKIEKPKKIKLVRDSFTVPKNELIVLDDLKLRALSLKVGVKKGELLRAGIKALAAMSDAAFLAAIKAVPALKTGRPKK